MYWTRTSVLLVIFISVLLLSLLTYGSCYVEFSLESPDLCSPNKKNIIKLGNGTKSGLIIDQKGAHNLDLSKDFLCEFQVQAQDLSIQPSESSGIFLVIQSLYLRKNEDTGECIDYVLIETKNGRITKFCGEINANLIMGADSNKYNHISNNTLVDTDGIIKVKIFIKNIPPVNNAVTDIEMVFTVSKAHEQASESDKPCVPNDNQSRYINKDFINDGYINCPYPECTDEGGCSTVKNDDSGAKSESVGNGVMIRSAPPLFFTFRIIICCIAVSCLGIKNLWTP